MAINPISQRYPFELRDQSPEVVQAHRYAFQGIVDLNEAIASLKSQITNLSPVSTVAVASTGSGALPVPAPFPFAGLGAVNDLTGVTTYTVVANDNGILLIFNDTSPVAVSLNSALSAPYFFFITNFGAGLATLTPTTGTINGGASYALPQNYFAMVVFDGTNWKTSAEVLPQTFSAISHQWLKDYSAVTGLFTASQPKATDIQNPYTAVSATYAILATDFQIECTANTFTVTLPTAVGVTGQIYSIKNSGAGTITVATTSAQTIDGSVTQTLAQWDNLLVMSNGANWMVI